MTLSFDDLPWHDALLLKIEVDRSSAGERDEVAIVVRWPDGKSEKVVFAEVYAFRAEMNFGVLAEESIRSARVLDDAETKQIVDKWRSSGINLVDLKRFDIETAATASRLAIFGRGFSLRRMEGT